MYIKNNLKSSYCALIANKKFPADLIIFTEEILNGNIMSNKEQNSSILALISLISQ